MILNSKPQPVYMLNRARKVLTLLGALIVAFLCFSAFGVRAQEGFDLERILRATVYIMQARTVGTNLIITCVGSGTIVSRDGLILTNAHNVVTGQNCPGNTLIVALSTRLDEPPIPRYQAEIVQADSGLDLALLRITRQNDGRLIEPESLALPFVELANSDTVTLDSTLTVVGYPGVGDDPVAVERGTVIGFAAEPSGGDKSWIKTSASIRGTMSGGGAYDSEGRLVAIPTSAPVSAASPEATCVTVQDTNRDNLINASDSCIPIGGAINSLRPVNFVQPLLRAASLGLRVETLTRLSAPTSQLGTPTLRYLGFSPSVNEAGMPSTIVRALPSGSTSLYLFFDYENMTPETVYELRVAVNGVPNPTFSLSPVRWSGGQRGLWYVGSTGQPWPNGLYDFTLLVDGNVAGNARLLVGAPPEQTPEFSDLVFSLLDPSGNVFGNGYILPTSTTASARFLYRNIPPGMPWAYIWYYEGREIDRSPDGMTWLETDGTSGTKTISIQDPNGLPPGNYRLVLYIDNRLSAVSDFTLAGAQDGAQAIIFPDVHFTTAPTPEEAQRGAPITTFTAGTNALYVLFDWRRIAPGTLWTMRWYVDDDLFYQQTQPWSGSETGDNFLLRLTAPTGIPDGTYRIDLFINRLQFATASARVGIGQLPIDRFAQTSGVQFRGQVLDAATNAGVAGATVFVISEDYSVSEFTRDWRQDQLYAVTFADRNGRFEVDRPLQRDLPYSIFVLAEGYLPIAADGVVLNAETWPDDTPIDVQIYLTRG